jgi:hypothetical protein
MCKRLILRHYDYFGARYYDSELSVWLSVDPLNILYPNQSPFAYAGNNPIFYVDPDGRTIVPHGSDEFMAQFYKDLEMLSQTDEGKKIVDYLQSPSILINVFENGWGNSTFNSSTNVLNYDNNNLFDYDYDGVEYVSFIALGHELKHAYDKYTMSNFYTSSTLDKERSAIKFENYLRSVFKNELDKRGIPFALRYTYSEGKSYLGGRVVIFGRKHNLFDSKKTEIDFNPHLERINTSFKYSINKTYNVGDRSIKIVNPGIKVTTKTYENKNSERHKTVLNL